MQSLDNIVRLQRLVVGNWLAKRRNTVDIVDTVVGIVVLLWGMWCCYSPMLVQQLPCS